MQNVLFIGGAGFIGSGLIRELERRGGYKIYVLEPPQAYLGRLNNCAVKRITASLADVEYIGELIKSNGITTVVHLVSSLIPGSNFEAYVKELDSVVIPTLELIRLCARLNVKLVYFSSGGAVYGERESLDAFTEKDPKEPISYYGRSKQMIENSILFEHRVNGLKYLILRPSNPYGPGQNINGNQGLIAVAIGKILKGESIEVWGDGTSIRDYIFIDDLSRIVAELLINGVNNTTLNIGSGRGYSVNQVLSAIARIVDEDVRIEYEPKRKADVSNMILDITLLKSIVPMVYTSLEEGIRIFYGYEKKDR